MPCNKTGGLMSPQHAPFFLPTLLLFCQQSLTILTASKPFIYQEEGWNYVVNSKKRASCHCLTTLGRGWEGTRLQNRHPEIPEKKQWGHAVYSVPGTGVPPPPMLPPERQSPGGRRRAAWTRGQVLRAPLPPADSDITHTRAVVPGKGGTVRGVGRAARPFRARRERTWASRGLTSPPGLSVALPIPIMLQFTIVLASPGPPLQGQRASAYVSITAGELRLWKQFNRTKSQTSQTNDPPAFSIAGSPLPAPDVDPGTLEKRREKVTKLSWEESELAKRSLHRSRAARWKQALTIKIERVNRRRRDPSSESWAERNPPLRSRQRTRPTKWWPTRKPTYPSPSRPPQPRPACSCLCSKSPRSREQDSPRASWSASSPVDLRASRPGLAAPGG